MYLATGCSFGLNAGLRFVNSPAKCQPPPRLFFVAANVSQSLTVSPMDGWSRAKQLATSRRKKRRSEQGLGWAPHINAAEFSRWTSRCSVDVVASTDGAGCLRIASMISVSTFLTGRREFALISAKITPGFAGLCCFVRESVSSHTTHTHTRANDVIDSASAYTFAITDRQNGSPAIFLRHYLRRHHQQHYSN